MYVQVWFIAIQPGEVVATAGTQPALGVQCNPDMGPRYWQPLLAGLKQFSKTPLPYLTGETTIFPGTAWPLRPFIGNAEFALRGRAADDIRTLLLKEIGPMPSLVNEAKRVLPEMIRAVKHYVPDYLFSGKFGAPPPALLRACKHIKPNNDAQERFFGIVDFRVHKHPNESTEMTDARLKNKIVKPEEALEKMALEEREKAWQGASAELNRRLEKQKERRSEYAQAKQVAIQAAMKTNAKKVKRKKQKTEEFKAVKVMCNKAKLDKHLNGAGPQVGKAIIISQIRQLTGVHGVSTHILPLTKNGQRRDFDALYANLTELMQYGDPTDPATAERYKAAKAKRKRGRPAGSSKSVKKQKNGKSSDDRYAEWLADE